MKLLFNCQGYRGLQNVLFEPDGVCALVGANGSGKSSLLSALEFLSSLFTRTIQSAIELDGGHWGLTNLNSTSDSVEMVLNLDGAEWYLHLAPFASGDYVLDEHIRNGAGNDLLIHRRTNLSKYSYRGTEIKAGEGSFLRMVWDLHQDPEIEDLVKFIQNIRTYRRYRLSQLREHGSRAGSEIRLQREGNNLFAVLRNWRDRRELKSSYDFVIESLRAAFEDFFEDFEFYGDAQTVRAKVYLRGIREAMPLSFVPDGLLIAMLHLAAVAGAPAQSFIAIDDFENYLHPFAIRSLFESIRGLTSQRDLSVLIATHSPVVLDEFRTEPHRVFVMDFEPPNKPIPLDQLRDSEWLSHFSLGDLYTNLEFGAPAPFVSVSPDPTRTNEPAP